MGAADFASSTNLARALRPRSIALLGATPRAGSFSARTIANLARFSGDVHLVNPKYTEIDGRPCHASLAEFSGAVDSAIIAVPGSLVEDALEQCVRAGVGGAIVYASGYAEMGDPDNVARQDRLMAIAREGGVRLVGPNCMGVVNYGIGAVQSFQQFPPVSPNNGRAIGLISQSGALALALSQATERGVSFSHILTFGNAADADLGDMVSFLVAEPECHAIACAFEGLAHPEKLIQAAALAWQHDKPLIIYKLATGAQGAKAALSHTGTLAGSHEQYRAALEHHGAIVIDRFDALLEIASFFAKAGPCRADGVGIVAASGGAGIMGVDKAELHGVNLPQPAPHTRAALQANIPAFGSPNNPCDVTAEVVNRPESLDACMHAMAQDPAYGALVVPHTVAGNLFTSRLDIYARTAEQYGKPVCAVWLSAWQNGPGSIAFESNPHVPVFSSMDNCFHALQRWQWRSALGAERSTETLTSAATRTQVADYLRQQPSGAVLTEAASKRLLVQYGVATNREQLVDTIEQASQAAAQIGYPVVLKAMSIDLPHKTEAGVVVLGIRDESELKQAFERIAANIARLPVAPRLDGFLVQEMVQGGVEIMVGGTVDAHFGPMIVVGAGGILVELIKDTVIAPAPVSVERASRMLASLKSQALLDGFRGADPVDRGALARVISQISQLIAEHADDIAELDVNPMLCKDKEIIAVDALIVRK